MRMVRRREENDQLKCRRHKMAIVFHDCFPRFLFTDHHPRPISSTLTSASWQCRPQQLPDQLYLWTLILEKHQQGGWRWSCSAISFQSEGLLSKIAVYKLMVFPEELLRTSGSYAQENTGKFRNVYVSKIRPTEMESRVNSRPQGYKGAIFHRLVSMSISPLFH